MKRPYIKGETLQRVRVSNNPHRVMQSGSGGTGDYICLRCGQTGWLPVWGDPTTLFEDTPCTARDALQQ